MHVNGDKKPNIGLHWFIKWTETKHAFLSKYLLCSTNEILIYETAWESVNILGQLIEITLI